jgi:hypothetical protein
MNWSLLKSISFYQLNVQYLTIVWSFGLFVEMKRGHILYGVNY